jgi:hypothetical protein
MSVPRRPRSIRSRFWKKPGIGLVALYLDQLRNLALQKSLKKSGGAEEAVVDTPGFDRNNQLFEVPRKGY